MTAEMQILANRLTLRLLLLPPQGRLVTLLARAGMGEKSNGATQSQFDFLTACGDNARAAGQSWRTDPQRVGRQEK